MSVLGQVPVETLVIDIVVSDTPVVLTGWLALPHLHGVLPVSIEMEN